MCFNLNIPLVDSGTNGYAAQVSFFWTLLINSVFQFARARLPAISASTALRIRVSQCARFARSLRKWSTVSFGQRLSLMAYSVQRNSRITSLKISLHKFSQLEIIPTKFSTLQSFSIVCSDLRFRLSWTTLMQKDSSRRLLWKRAKERSKKQIVVSCLRSNP